ncbi:hypothetical protein [Pedobacter miscanthi]|jgi:hypothetical protein|uniref:hypothetical protein n=1 Tax=Pedobacter miscanthi TaxID=2259170 RepID=UPI0029314D32|nr:hypothetical protein [Pedobacter miscanthi]
MKIFNVQPIRINEYIYNEEYLAESQPPGRYESGFGFTGEKIEGLNTLFVKFNIQYYVEHAVDDENIITPNGPNSWNMHVSISIGEEEFISYNSSCEFNFESEGFNADVISLTDFLVGYHAQANLFFSQHAHKSLIEIEKDTDGELNLRTSAIAAIENLRANNMYEF